MAVMETNEVEILAAPSYVISPAGYTYRSGSTDPNFCIIEYKNAETGKRFRVLGDNLPDMRDVEVLLRGYWKNNSKYGEGFHVNSFEIKLPSSERGIVAYLSSLRVRIGRNKAEQLYARFGEGLWDILETDPTRLTEVRGISDNTVKALVEKMDQTKIDRELIQLFSGVFDSVTARKLAELKRAFGPGVVSILKANPYVLCQVKGFSFEATDRLGKKLGIATNSPERIQAAILHLLDKAAMSGHTCLPKDELLTQLLRLLNAGLPFGQTVTNEDILAALRKAWNEEQIRTTAGMVYAKRRYEQEVSVAKDVARLLTDNAGGIENVDKFIAEFESESGIALADNQKDAVRNAFRNKMSIITGGPGTGKTTIINAILFVHRKVYGNTSEPVFMSPTGKAARRMTEATGFPASTIHSAVGYRGDDVDVDSDDDEDDKMLKGNLFIVDEFSMADLFITSVLLRKIPDEARLICVGDPDQLPSVGYGNVLYEMIRSKRIPTTKLNVIFRQEGTSAIVTNAAKIRDGGTDLTYNTQFCLIKKESTDEVFQQTVNRYCECVKRHGIDNVILLCPYRKKGTVQVNRFNQELQKRINPVQPDEPTIRGENFTVFHAGDKIIQTRNTDIARNGDVGYIKRIEEVPDPDYPKDKVLTAVVEFNGDGIEHRYTQTDMQDIDLAYCTTVHKSQGSEYKVVIIALSVEHRMLLKRNVIYTGVTRAKEHVLIITEKEGAAEADGSHAQVSALNKAIVNNNEDTRYSLLADRIVAYTKKN